MSLFAEQEQKSRFKTDIRQVEILFDKIKTVEDIAMIMKATNWTLWVDINQQNQADLLTKLKEKGIVREVKNE